MTIDIIGAGIGGLTTAIALRQQGFEVRIFERAAELQPVGAGIVLAANAMQVYRDLGLDRALLERGVGLAQAAITDDQLRPLAQTQWSLLEEVFGVKTVGIHRGALQQTLLEQLPTEALYLDHSLEQLEQTAEGLTLHFANGQHYASALSIGTDGIHSQVRQALFPGHGLRHAQQYCWRGVARYALPESLGHQLTEAWGAGIRFGIVPIGDGRVYWFAVESTADGLAPTETAALPARFGAFDGLVPELLRATPVEQIHGTVLSDLQPLPQWHQGRVCLLGDAAHAPTPNMGQGAGQAIEDARVLALCLAQNPSPAAFAQFEALRRPKASQIVRTSWLIGQVAHWKNPIARGLRRLILRSTPHKTQQKQLEQLATLAEVPQ